LMMPASTARAAQLIRRPPSRASMLWPFSSVVVDLPYNMQFIGCRVPQTRYFESEPPRKGLAGQTVVPTATFECVLLD
jgi:hypothetical protein